MLRKCLRFVLLLATLVASFPVAAEPRVWTLADVRIRGVTDYEPLAPVTGYFIYDDAKQTILNWSVHLRGWFDFPPFTYVPGNSLTYVFNDGPRRFLGFSAVMGAPGPNFGVRQLQLAPLAALDGSNATVVLNVSESREDFIWLAPSGRALIATGSLTLTPQQPPAVVSEVQEFYHPGLRHYFITADDTEKQLLGSGFYPGWQPTGEAFKAYGVNSRAGGSISPVCRFYSPPCVPTGDGCAIGINSHFFSADASECLAAYRKYDLWRLERDNAFQINVPDKKTGACSVGTIPVYRLWNNRMDSNHRHTTSMGIRTEMLAAGYLADGYGPDGVVMCAVQ